MTGPGVRPCEAPCDNAGGADGFRAPPLELPAPCRVDEKDLHGPAPNLDPTRSTRGGGYVVCCSDAEVAIARSAVPVRLSLRRRGAGRHRDHAKKSEKQILHPLRVP